MQCGRRREALGFRLSVLGNDGRRACESADSKSQIANCKLQMPARHGGLGRPEERG